MRDTGSMFRCRNGHVYPKRLGRTCPYCGLAAEYDDGAPDTPRNISDIESQLLFERTDPVCGWLACIDGPRQGLSFTLHGGKNFIGRADDMDVRLPGDDAVARRNHAVIAYDPKNRKFMLIPGDSEGIVYLDGDAIYEPQRLTDMNLIKLGRTTLLFRPLCGDNFNWEYE
ncbi:MAG: FHA domain-containing protein [Clostridiales Family XIII bacterium]|nr:FHA domain-containing protein [Clostridiales Family XIII bacterium]